MTIQCKPLARLGYSIAEVAEITTLSRSTVYNHIAAGRLTAKRIGGRTIIPATALHTFLEGDK